jgi:YggT family protein
MLTKIILFIAEVACDVLSAALLARFLLQWVRAPFRNPIGQFVVAITDWAVRPARKVVPGLMGLDLASLLLAWLVQLGYMALAYSLTSLGQAGGGLPLAAMMAVALLELCRTAIHLTMLVVLVSVVLSWVNPYAPLAPFFDALSRPLLAPFRRIVPPLGGVDLSPMLLLLALQVLLMLLDGMRNAAFGVFL